MMLHYAMIFQSTRNVSPTTIYEFKHVSICIYVQVQPWRNVLQQDMAEYKYDESNDDVSAKRRGREDESENVCNAGDEE